MGKPAPKTSALIVSAIRKLREVQGSTSREIMNFITTEYDIPGPKIKRQLQAALKRGLEFGILKCQHGYYTLNTDGTGSSIATSDEGPVDVCRKKKRKYRKCKKTRRCARGCVPNRRKKKCGKKRRRSRCKKRCRNMDPENLALSAIDGRTRNEITAQRSQHSSRSTCSQSQSRSRSHSRNSSRNEGREMSLDRHEKQTD